MTTRGKHSYGFIVIGSQKEVRICSTPLHWKNFSKDSERHFVCIRCIEPLDVTFSCSPVSEQTVHRRPEQEDSQATTELNTFLLEQKTRGCVEKTHQLAGEQKSANGSSALPQQSLSETGEGGTSHDCAPAAATTRDSESLRKCLKSSVGFMQLLLVWLLPLIWHYHKYFFFCACLSL